MAIKVRCSCGKALSVEDKHAGKRVRCPKCKEAVRVPTQLESEEEEAKVSYGVEGVSKEGKELPKKGAPKKPACYFCGEKKNVKVFRIWTATLGDPVEIHGPDGNVFRARSFNDITEHQVPGCIGCARQMWRSYRNWVLVVAALEFVGMIAAAVGSYALWVYWGDVPSNRLNLILAPVAVFATGMALIGTLGYYFSRINFDKAESAVGHYVYKDLDPDADAWLSLTGFKALQPQQISGEPTNAGLAIPRSRHRDE